MDSQARHNGGGQGVKKPGRKPGAKRAKARRKPVERDVLMERTRGAVALANSMRAPGLEMAAFLGLFHPDMSDAMRHGLVQDARRNDERRRALGYG